MMLQVVKDYLNVFLNNGYSSRFDHLYKSIWEDKYKTRVSTRSNGVDITLCAEAILFAIALFFYGAACNSSIVNDANINNRLMNPNAADVSIIWFAYGLIPSVLLIVISDVRGIIPIHTSVEKCECINDVFKVIYQDFENMLLSDKLAVIEVFSSKYGRSRKEIIHRGMHHTMIFLGQLLPVILGIGFGILRWDKIKPSIATVLILVWIILSMYFYLCHTFIRPTIFPDHFISLMLISSIRIGLLIAATEKGICLNKRVIQRT